MGCSNLRGFNNPTFADCTIEIIHNETKEIIHVSKFVLAKNSSYFRHLFQQHGSSPLPLILAPGQDPDLLKDALRCTYKEEPLDTSRPHLIKIMSLCTPKIWDLPVAIKQCIKILSEGLVSWDKDLKNLFELPIELRELDQVKKFLLTLEALVLEKFKSVRDIFYDLKDLFLELPFAAVLAILKSDTIQVDSENSLFYAVWTWLKYQKNEEKELEYLQQALDYIRFTQMRRYFLLDVIPYVASLYPTAICKKMLFLQSLAMEIKYACSSQDTISWKCLSRQKQNYILTIYKSYFPNSLCIQLEPRKPETNLPIYQDFQPPPPASSHLAFSLENRTKIEKISVAPVATIDYQPEPRKTFKEKTNSFTIKCEFRNISKLDVKSRYYSAPVVAHGYEFYFFLRKQRIDPLGNDDSTNLALAGYLRCTSKILPTKYFLPIQSTVAVQMESQDGVTQRKFAPSAVIFEAPEKAIGGRLTLSDENWKTIEDQLCPIVIRDTLTAFVTVEFLDTDKNCRAVEETLTD